jgi:hypothetical protein
MAYIMVVAALIISPACAEENETVKKDLAKLQREWSMVSGSADGQPMPEYMRSEMKRVCKGDETTKTMSVQMFVKAKITGNQPPDVNWLRGRWKG